MINNKIRIKTSVMYFLCTVIIIIASFITFIYYKKYTKDYILKEITYYSTDNSSYDVYYSGSNMASGKTKEEGFIRKYTNHIDLNFDYELNFSDMVSGTQESLVKATLIIYAPNSETEIWKSDVDYLLPSKKFEYENANRYRFSNKTSIDYQKYLKIYEQFKEETSIVSNAKISIEFINSSIAETKDIPKITKLDTITYSIPLSDVTFTIDKDTNFDTKEITIKNIIKDKYKNIYLCVVICGLIIIVTMILLMILRYFDDRTKKGLYKNKLAKILKAYDNIIVNIETLPSLKGKEIINVTSFEELLDAQMEIRVPINYYETITNCESKFIIIKNDIAWVYILKKEGR